MRCSPVFALLYVLLLCGTAVGQTIPLKRIPKSFLKNLADSGNNLHERDSSESIDLGGGIESNGEFYAELQIGSDSQTFDVQVDTGSSDLLIFGQGCGNCGSSPTYDYSLSSDSSLLPCASSCPLCADVASESTCSFSDTYGDGSNVQGFVVTDVLAVGSSISGVNVELGSIQTSSSNFENPPVSGIWGLAYSSLSDWDGTTAFDNIVQQDGIPNSFSMCLTTSDPVMSLGVDYSSDSRFSWTSITQQTYYAVSMEDLQVDGNSLGLSPNAYNNPLTIVDSGTTLFYVSNTAYSALVSSFGALCGSNSLHGICDVSSTQTMFDGVCYQMSQSQLNAYPSIGVVLSGISDPLTLGPTQYLVPQGSYYCFGIYPSAKFSILGDVFMQNWHVVFDRANSKVGFGPIDSCSASSLLQSHPAVVAASTFLTLLLVFIF